MAVTYYVALPLVRTEEGVAPGEGKEMPNERAAIRQAEAMSRDPANAGALAFLFFHNFYRVSSFLTLIRMMSSQLNRSNEQTNIQGANWSRNSFTERVCAAQRVPR